MRAMKSTGIASTSTNSNKSSAKSLARLGKKKGGRGLSGARKGGLGATTRTKSGGLGANKTSVKNFDQAFGEAAAKDQQRAQREAREALERDRASQGTIGGAAMLGVTLGEMDDSNEKVESNIDQSPNDNTASKNTWGNESSWDSDAFFDNESNTARYLHILITSSSLNADLPPTVILLSQSQSFPLTAAPLCSGRS
eukprot:TRINITY_DN5075_c1_g1_i7.p1 TRINITY_DN5075_c1_g1~~TRINITY_DN5075_c1_g1_i7.p1  ORF type:complete len:197 (+),score=52.36 TRINITY_DN5075_c1_g1_i7:2040-2630(+)